MILTKKILSQLQRDCDIRLTKEQKAIMFLWFGSDSNYGWSMDDFFRGLGMVDQFYPDHRNSDPYIRPFDYYEMLDKFNGIPF